MLGVVCSMRDVTERRRAADEMQLALNQARELNLLKSRFTAMVSHEFRTPLAVIQSSTDLLRRYADRMPDEKRQAALAQITTQVSELVALLDDILMLGRADAIGLAYQPERTDFAVYVATLVQQAQQTTTEHELRLNVQGEPRLIEIDLALMHQALTNLLSNAIKYSPDGGTITIDVHFQPDTVLLRVTDPGLGIEASDLAHIFDEFHRGGNVGAISGTGLGLPIVRRAVEMHGGTIEVASTPGSGSSFTVTLPQA
jgi:signal transduction histidine kinase